MKRKKKKQKGFSMQKTALLVLLIFFVGVGATIWYYAVFKIVHTDYLEMAVKVPSQKTKIGFSTDPTLYFGKVPPGGKAMKEIHVWNSEDFPVRVEVRLTGDFAEWVYVTNTTFVLESQKAEKIHFFVRVPINFSVPEDVEYLELRGKTRIRHYRI